LIAPTYNRGTEVNHVNSHNNRCLRKSRIDCLLNTRQTVVYDIGHNYKMCGHDMFLKAKFCHFCKQISAVIVSYHPSTEMKETKSIKRYKSR